MMITNASIAETVSGGHYEWWQSAVNDRLGMSIDEAIQKSKEVSARQIAQLREGKRSVSKTMSKLQGPPAEYAAVYYKLITLFGLFNSFVDLAISPSGSFRSYGESVRRLQEELVRGINEIKVMLPQ